MVSNIILVSLAHAREIEGRETRKPVTLEANLSCLCMGVIMVKLPDNLTADEAFELLEKVDAFLYRNRKSAIETMVTKREDLIAQVKKIDKRMDELRAEREGYKKDAVSIYHKLRKLRWSPVISN